MSLHSRWTPSFAAVRCAIRYPSSISRLSLISAIWASADLANSRRFMEDEFAERDIKPLVSQAIQEVAPGEIRLKDGNKIPFKLAMIAPPFKGVPAVAPLGNPRGFIPVDKNYRHTKHKNIFAIGVAMAIAPPEADAGARRAFRRRAS